MSLDGTADPAARDGHGSVEGGGVTGGETGATAESDGLLDALRAVVQQELRAALTSPAPGGRDTGESSAATPPASAGDTGEEKAQSCKRHEMV